jgi:hypothetical protein
MNDPWDEQEQKEAREERVAWENRDARDETEADPAAMIEAIHAYVMKWGTKVRMRGGYEMKMYHIGVCPVEAITEDEGYTHGIYCPDLISAWNTYGRGYSFSSNDEETLLSLYRLMMKT